MAYDTHSRVGEGGAEQPENPERTIVAQRSEVAPTTQTPAGIVELDRGGNPPSSSPENIWGMQAEAPTTLAVTPLDTDSMESPVIETAPDNEAERTVDLTLGATALEGAQHGHTGRFPPRYKFVATGTALVVFVGAGVFLSPKVFGDNGKDKGSSSAGPAPGNLPAATTAPTATPSPEPAPEAIADVQPSEDETFVNYPHDPRGPQADRGTIDTSVEISAENVGYTLDIKKAGTNKSIIIARLPKLEQPANNAESIQKSFNDATIVLDAMMTAVINPNPDVNQGKLQEMLDIYAADPAAMKALLMRRRDALRIACNAGDPRMPEAIRDDIAVMIYDTRNTELTIANRNITENNHSVLSAMTVVDGTAELRGVRRRGDVYNWQDDAAVVQGEGYVLGLKGIQPSREDNPNVPPGAFFIVLNSRGEIVDFSLNLSPDGKHFIPIES